MTRPSTPLLNAGTPAPANPGALRSRLVDPRLTPCWVQPTNGTLVRTRPRHGVDIVTAPRAPIYAAHDGIVREVGEGPDGGWSVDIDHPDGTRTRYANVAARPSVSAGATVRTGQVIGYVGAPTLHFLVYTVGGDAIDPVSYLAARGIDLHAPATGPSAITRADNRRPGSLQRLAGRMRNRRGA